MRTNKILKPDPPRDYVVTEPLHVSIAGREAKARPQAATLGSNRPTIVSKGRGSNVFDGRLAKTLSVLQMHKMSTREDGSRDIAALPGVKVMKYCL